MVIVVVSFWLSFESTLRSNSLNVDFTVLCPVVQLQDAQSSWAFVYRAIPSPAITAANKEIKQLTAKSSKRGPYHRYTAKERADIGMYALQNGVQAARQKFSQ